MYSKICCPCGNTNKAAEQLDCTATAATDVLAAKAKVVFFLDRQHYSKKKLTNKGRYKGRARLGERRAM